MQQYSIKTVAMPCKEKLNFVYLFTIGLLYKVNFLNLKLSNKKATRKKYIFIVALYFFCQFILINYVSPLLDKNHLSEIWNDGIAYAISVIVYVIFCLIFSLLLILLQVYFLRIWIFRLNDIGVRKYLCVTPVLFFLIMVINNFFIFNSWIIYSYYFLIFISCIPSSGYAKQTTQHN